MRTLDTLSFSGKRAVIRVDFNVPLDADFQITDDSRMSAAMPTIQHILDQGGSVVILSHLGRPKNGPEEAFSLRHLVDHLSVLSGRPVKFAGDCIGEEAEAISAELQAGEILLMENLRFYKEETAGDPGFAEALSRLGDIYVNDAFGTAHRAHASTAVIAQFFEQRCFGTLMAREVANASKLMGDPQRPFAAIVGGAKVSDKILIIQNLLSVADHIIIGGGMAYTFMKAQGGAIGNSLFEEDRVATCLEILDQAKAKGVQIHLPVDSVVASEFSNDAQTKVEESNAVSDGWMGLDVGPVAAGQFRDVLMASKTILWNGPMGVFEMSSFENGTRTVAQAVADATSNGAFSLIGGGDSSAAVKKFGFTKQVSYVSTGGGALLEYFEGKTLPGIAAIES